VETIITKEEKLQVIRWINLAVGVIQLHYWVEGASWFVLAIALANVAVFAFTRK